MRGTGPLVLVILAACSSSVGPRSGVTVLVTNETCSAGACDTLTVLAFPGVQPRVPSGAWRIELGTVTTPQACLTIPATAKFLVVGVNEDGTRDTTTTAWSNDQPLRLGTLPPNATSIGADTHPSESFVPATAAGWAISVPSANQAVSASACQP